MGGPVAILTIQILNSLLYASVLFLIAAGLSLIFGVMRIVNLAHGSLYAVGAYFNAWLVGRDIALRVPLSWLFLLMPVGALSVALIGIVIEPLLLRPFYRRAEEYQLLVTFGLLQILEDLMRLVWGGTPLSADTLMDVLPILRVGGLFYPAYNLLAIGIGCFMAGLGGAIVVPTQAAVLGMGVDALVIAFVVVVIGGLGSLKGALVGAVVVSFVRTAGIQFFPELELAVLYLIAALVLLVRPTGLFGTA